MAGLGDVAGRVDASSEIGLGHVRRCVTLLRQLCVDGFKVRLVSRHRFGKDLGPLIRGIPISWMEDAADDEEQDAAATLSIIGRHPAGPSWVVVDHYGLGERWERVIREAGHRVLAIDDFRNRSHCADILVSDTSAPFDPALNAGRARARELLGSKFALVDPEFYFSEEASPTGARKKLLVAYGGSDPTDETSKALEAVRLLRRGKQSRGRLGKVDVVVGPANTRADHVVRLAKEIEDVAVHLAPASLAPLLRDTDLFLTAGGNSMVEALTMRKPCLVTSTSDNQALIVAQLLKKRAIISLGDHAEVDPLDVAKAVIAAVADYDRFYNGLKAQPLFDHHGAQRISETIQSMSSRKHK